MNTINRMVAFAVTFCHNRILSDLLVSTFFAESYDTFFSFFFFFFFAFTRFSEGGDKIYYS